MMAAKPCANESLLEVFDGIGQGRGLHVEGDGSALGLGDGVGRPRAKAAGVLDRRRKLASPDLVQMRVLNGPALDLGAQFSDVSGPVIAGETGSSVAIRGWRAKLLYKLMAKVKYVSASASKRRQREREDVEPVDCLLYTSPSPRD